MPLSAAERQRRYKEKMKKDPEKYEEYKRKKKVNYHAKKKLIKDMTPKEKHNARVIWRIRKQNLRKNRKNVNNVINMTPPSSPSLCNEELPLVAPKKETRGNEALRKKYERFKKRCQRRGLYKKEEKEVDEMDKYKKLSNAIKEKYKCTRKHKEKNALKGLFKDIDDSQKQDMIKESLGITGPIRAITKVHHQKKTLKKIIETFFHREDISRATAGKKETITRQGQKMQKRYMLDNMKNLYKTFMLENPGIKCSYYYLTQNKPFYIVKPSVSGREMCLCKTHTNPFYKASALKNKDVISTDDMSKLIATTVCNPKEEACMYGICPQCRDLEIKFNYDKDIDIIKWKEWGRVEEIYEKEGKKFKVFKNVKQERTGTVIDLTTEFNKELKILKKHVYNMKVQFANFRHAVDNLQQSEAVIVADFSENYSCKHHEEIQAHHFGGSRQQVSLHTVVVYVKDDDNNKKVESYCTVSSNTNHQPAAIWAHLDPVLKDIRRSYPEITLLHFFTDGPFSQYRQKQNFYLSATILFDHEFKAMTWSFFEAGHGKGPADGIGGFLKRSADELVARGEDITCANKFYDVLKDVSKVKLYPIVTSDIEKVAKQIPAKIQPLVGTKDLHQIFTNLRGQLKYRNLSCFCNRGFCECLSPKTYHPLPIVSLTAHKKVDKHVGESTNIIEMADKNFDVDMSPNEDQPLSIYKIPQQKFPLKEIEFSDLGKPRTKNLYNIIYKSPDTSDDETVATDQPTTSIQHKENRGVRRGDFLLVNVCATKGKIFKYICTVDDLHDDGEIRVTFLRSVKNKKNTYSLQKNDVSDIDYTDIVEILPDPTISTKRGQQYYVFGNDVQVIEK